MMPVLFTFGGFHIYSMSIAIILAWIVFSFFFWRALRNAGVAEERIFDLTFYGTLAAFLFARVGYVLLNLEQFSSDPLRIVALWIAPGMSLYGALIGGLGTIIYLSRQYKVRVGQVLDSFVTSFGWAYVLGLVGAFLDGSYVGTAISVPWAVRYVGHLGTRHPVQGYEALVTIIILVVIFVLSRRARKNKWPYGLLGLWFFALWTTSEFALELFKDTRVYFGYLRANQWVLVALFAETMGAFYVRGGGREVIRPFINKVIGGIHGKLSKRSA